MNSAYPWGVSDETVNAYPWGIFAYPWGIFDDVYRSGQQNGSLFLII